MAVEMRERSLSKISKLLGRISRAVHTKPSGRLVQSIMEVRFQYLQYMGYFAGYVAASGSKSS